MTYKRFAVICAWIGLVMCALPIYAWVRITLGGDLETLLDPVSSFGLIKGYSELMFIGNIGDLFGYYVLVVPIVIGLAAGWWRAKIQLEWIGLAACFGLAYCVNGAVGAARSAEVMAFLAGQPVSEATQLAYQIHVADVQMAQWGMMGSIWGGLYWIIAGIVLLRLKNRSLGIATLALGVGYFLQGKIFPSTIVSIVGLVVYLFFAPVWAVWAARSIADS